MKYRSVTGHNYISKKTGKEVRAEPGQVVDDMTDLAVELELEAGNLEEVKDDGKRNARKES